MAPLFARWRGNLGLEVAHAALVGSPGRCQQDGALTPAWRCMLTSVMIENVWSEGASDETIVSACSR